MSKTILGSIGVVICGVLLMPMLVDTAPPSAPTAEPAAQHIAIAELVRGR